MQNLNIGGAKSEHREVQNLNIGGAKSEHHYNNNTNISHTDSNNTHSVSQNPHVQEKESKCKINSNRQTDGLEHEKMKFYHNPFSERNSTVYTVLYMLIEEKY